MTPGNGKLMDFQFYLCDHRIKLRNFHRILPLLMFSEPKKVGLVLRTETMEEKFIFLEDAFPHLLSLIKLRASLKRLALPPLRSGSHGIGTAVYF